MKKIYFGITIVAAFVLLVVTEANEPLVHFVKNAVVRGNSSVVTQEDVTGESSPKVDLDMLLKPSNLSDTYVDNYATAYGMYYSPAVEMDRTGPGYYGTAGVGLGITSDGTSTGSIDSGQSPTYAGGVFPGRAPDLLHVADVTGIQSLAAEPSGGSSAGNDQLTGGQPAGDEVGSPNSSGQTPPAPVPEPSTIFLFATGLMGLLPFTRRHRSPRK